MKGIDLFFPDAISLEDGLRRHKATGTCLYCKRALEAVNAVSSLATTRDHIYPRSLGGTIVAPACKKCNLLKGDMLPEEWFAFMQANPEWWKRSGRHDGVRAGFRPRRRIRYIPGRSCESHRRQPSLDDLPKEPWAVPASIPLEYADLEQQSGFEAAYNDRLHMLRVTAFTDGRDAG